MFKPQPRGGEVCCIFLEFLYNMVESSLCLEEQELDKLGAFFLLQIIVCVLRRPISIPCLEDDSTSIDPYDVTVDILMSLTPRCSQQWGCHPKAARQ